MENKEITIRQAQELVDRWILSTDAGYFSPLTNMAILTEEVGEVARLMSRQYGDQRFKGEESEKGLEDELADVLWVVLCLANQTGVDMTAALKQNQVKKERRDRGRHSGTRPRSQD